jgi:hypothetical protein
VAAELQVSLPAYLAHELLMAPGRVADKLLHALIVAATNVSTDAFDVLAPLPAQQASEIMAGVTNDIFAPDNEVMLKHRAVVDEIFRRVTQAREDIFFGAVVGGSASLPALLFISSCPHQRNSIV